MLTCDWLCVRAWAWRISGLMAALIATLCMAGVASAATITVTVGTDEFNTIPNSTCSLREAVQSVNIGSDFGGCVASGTYAGNNTIVFNVPTATLTLMSGSDNDDNTFYDLDVKGFGNLTIMGPVTVTAGPGYDRLFDINSSQPLNVLFHQVTLSGGSASLAETTSFGQACHMGGGAIRWRTNGGLTLQEVTVKNNQAMLNGGGVCVQNILPSLLNVAITNTQFISNTSAMFVGGGLYAENVIVSLLSSSFDGNQAGRSAGGLGQTGGRLTAEDVVFQNNQVNLFFAQGGAIGLQNVDATILQSDILSNRARGSGGGLALLSGQALIENSTIAMNVAGVLSDHVAYGGGIYASSANWVLSASQVTSNTVIISDTVVAMNPAGGGGVYHNGNLSVNNSNIMGNQVLVGDPSNSAAGGGLYVDASSVVDVQGSWMQGNQVHSPSSGTYGGGAYVHDDATVLILDSYVNDNIADGSMAFGGGIASRGVLALETSAVDGNQVKGNMVSGGGIYHMSSLPTYSLFLTGTIVANNASSPTSTFATGGGMFVVGDYQFENNVVDSNVVSGTVAQGGGLFTAGGSTFSVAEGMTVTNNHVTGSMFGEGGGWYVNNWGSVQNSVIQSNTATSNGGGAYIIPSSAFFFSNSSFEANEASFGGAVYKNGSGFLSFFQSNFIQNDATQDGGALYIAGSGMSSLGGSTLKNNAAIGDGGAVYVDGGSSLDVYASQFEANTAIMGSALFLSTTTEVAIYSSAILSNTSSITGAVFNAGALDVENSTFSFNQGGLLNAMSASAGLTHTTWYSNSGFALSNSVGGSVIVSATLLAENGCVGPITQDGLSLEYPSTTCGFALSGDPELQPLALNGGSTLNHALVPSSAAVNQVTCSLFVDQRNALRTNPCDVGAFELEQTDLVITKQVSSGTVLVGQELTFTLTITNLGPTSANGMVVTDVLPAGLVFSDVTSSFPVTCAGTSVITCTLPFPLFPFSWFDIFIVVTATQDGVFTNTAEVAFSGVEVNPTDNQASATVTVLPVADLQISKSASTPTLAGGVVTYTLHITNAGPSSAGNVVINDQLLGGTTFGGIVSAGGLTPTTAPTAITLTTPSLIPGSVTVVFTATLPASGVVTNAVSIFSMSTPDPNFSNNSTFITNTVQEVADLQISKSASTPTLAGGVVTYTLHITNTGPSPAGNVVINDQLLGGATFGGVVSAGGFTLAGFSSHAVTFTAMIGPVGSTTIVFTATAPANGPITNTATISSPITFDPQPGNNTGSVSTAVVPVADLEVTKQAPASVLAGSALIYTVTVTNYGPSTASNLVLTDVWTGGGVFGGVSVAGGFTLAGSTANAVTFTLPALNAGGSATVVYTLTAPVSGTVANTATVSLAGSDPVMSNNYASTSTPVIPVANLQVSKQAQHTPILTGYVSAGSVLTYVVKITNTGPSLALPLIVTDTLPTGVGYLTATVTPLSGSCLFGMGMVSCNVPGGLAANSSVTVNIVVTAPITAGVTFTNTAYAFSPAHPSVWVPSNPVTRTTLFSLFLPLVMR